MKSEPIRYYLVEHPEGDWDILTITRQPNNWFILSGSEPERFIKKAADPSELDRFIKSYYKILQEEN